MKKTTKKTNKKKETFEEHVDKQNKEIIILLIFLVVLVSGLFCMVAAIVAYSNKNTIKETDNGETEQITQVEQLEWDTNVPVMYVKNSRDYQKVAQTFSVQEGGYVLTGLDVWIGETSGAEARLEIFELTNERNPEEGKKLQTINLDFFDLPRSDFYSVEIEPETLKPNVKYSYVIKTIDKTSEVSVGKISYKDMYDGGRAFYYSKQVDSNGKVINKKHRWSDDKDDLTFRLNLEKLPVIE